MYRIIIILTLYGILGKPVIEKQCGSSIEIPGCDGVMNLSRTIKNTIKVSYNQQHGCTILGHRYDWSLLIGTNDTETSYYDHSDDGTFTITPYTIGTGEHRLEVVVNENGKFPNGTAFEADMTTSCRFRITPEKPIPIISGGTERDVRLGKEFTIEGSESIDKDVPPGMPGQLTFKWNCKMSGSPVDDFCSTPLGDKPYVTVPSKYAIADTIFMFGLAVKTNDFDWQTTNQIIYVVDAPILQIDCLKNCVPQVLKTNSKVPTILKVRCTDGCETLMANEYFWTINKTSFDYNRDTEQGREGDTFYIKENVLEVGEKYEIKVNHKLKPKGKAATVIDVHFPPKLDACKIVPANGKAFTTEFFANCRYGKGEYEFEIYSTGTKHDTLISRGITLRDMTFFLGIDTTIKIKIIDIYQFSDYKLVKVSVDRGVNFSGPATETVKHLEQFFIGKDSENSINNLLKNNRRTKAMQVINAVIDIIINLPEDDRKLTKNLEKAMLDSLDKIPLKTSTSAQKVATIAEKIIKQHIDKPDPDISNLATNICKKASDTYLKELQKEEYPGSHSFSVQNTAKIFSDCSQASANANNEFLVEAAAKPENFTISPILDMETISEQYPDYLSDNATNILNKFEESTENMIKICYSTSKVMSLTTVAEEKTKAYNTGYYEVTTTKINKAISNATVVSQDVHLIPSEDYREDKEISIFLCTAKGNPFWWDPKKKQPKTSVAFLQFEMEGKPLKSFRKPYFISFQVHKSIELSSIYEGITPRTVNGSRDSTQESFEQINIHRIDVFKNQGYTVEFLNLSTEDILKVLLAKLEKPTFFEFNQKSTKITQLSNKMYITNDLGHDTWHYLCVLPNKVKNNRKPYRFSVYTFSCLQWNSVNTAWKFACGSSPNASWERIECLCYHSSVLIGDVLFNPVKEEKTLLVEYELEAEVNYTVLICVATVFFIYCMLLSYFSVVKETVPKRFYFLSDIPSTYRYGYLVIVKTGNKSTAGTTSNVVLKLYGNEFSSKEHLLNYPDPEKRILQKNQEDWFFIATEIYLGDLEKLEIWFDAIGYKPHWYCSQIEIVDVQTNQYWLFEVNFQFEVSSRENHFYTAVPNSGAIIKKKFKTMVLNPFQGTHMWNILIAQEGFTRIERLTVMLSIFLTTCSIVLLLYGCPQLKNRDIISEYTAFGLYPQIFLASFGGFILTFALHYPFIYYTRISKRNLQEENVGIKKYIFWGPVIFIIMLTMNFLLIFGLWLPRITALLWLMSTIISLIVYIFLLENIAKLFVNLTVTRNTRIDFILRKLKTAINYVELQRRMLYKNFGSNVLRPYFSHLYTPLNQTKIKEKKYLADIKQQVIEILEDLFMLSIYIMLLYTVIVTDRDSMTYLSHNEVQELVKGIHVRTLNIEDIGSLADVENYISATLISSIQFPLWYGKYLIKDPGSTADNNNKYIGVVRLRQHRANNFSCTVPNEMKFLAKHCISDFKIGPQFTNFYEDWQNHTKTSKKGRLDQIWQYTLSSDAGTLPYTGKFGTYPGGGYIAPLGRTLENSKTSAEYLFNHGWIDIMTKCLFVEVLLYSPNSNLFSSVRVKFEISPVGYIRTKYNVHTARLLFVKEATGFFLILLLCGFILVVFGIVIKLVYRIYRKKRLYFKDAMRILDILLILLTAVCLFLYIDRSKLVKEFLAKVQYAKHNKFISYFHLFYAETSFTVLAAILVFLATFRLWKLLRFLVIIRVTEKTIYFSFIPLLCAFFCQLTVVSCFTITGMILFADKSFDFMDFEETLLTLFILSLGLKPFDFSLLHNSIHYVYYCFYMLFSILIYSLYITILTISYTEAQQFYSNLEEYTVIDYLKQQFSNYSTLFKIRYKSMRLRGGEEDSNRTTVSPKSDEHRYADCLTTTSDKIKSMSYVTLSVLKNKSVKKKYDAELMKRTVANLFRTDNEYKEIFYISNLEGYKKAVVDDITFLKMEKVVKLILGEDSRQVNSELRDRCRTICQAQKNKIEKINVTLNSLLNVMSRIYIKR